MPQPYHELLSNANVPQSQPINSQQVRNAAGGYAYVVDKWEQLDRFLILGTVGGTYYISERKLTKENISAVQECIAESPVRVLERLSEVSMQGLALKNDPAIFVLAILATNKIAEVRHAALVKLPMVCRIPTHLFTFMTYYNGLGGKSNSSVRKAIGQWYTSHEDLGLALHLTKYQQRDGMSNIDLINFSHPKPTTDAQKWLFEWTIKGKLPEPRAPESVRRYVEDYASVHTSVMSLADKLVAIRESKLPREVIPTELLNEPDVWNALLDGMPLHALVRNLGKMTQVGLLAPGSDATVRVLGKLATTDYKRARMHPIALLMALKTYQSGRGVKGSLSWKPVGQIVKALDEAIYMAYRGVEPSGKKILFGLDISGSMNAQAGDTVMECVEAGAALMTVMGNTEPAMQTMLFGTQQHHIEVNGRRIDDVLRTVTQYSEGTDLSQPFLYAINQKLDVDTFVVFTDNETWAGSQHPEVALEAYRRRFNANAKVVIINAVANLHTTQPKDARVLNVVGFDASLPQIIKQW